MFSAGYSVSVFTDWSDKAVVWVKRRVDHPVSKWTAGRQAQQGAAVDRLKISIIYEVVAELESRVVLDLSFSKSCARSQERWPCAGRL